MGVGPDRLLRANNIDTKRRTIAKALGIAKYNGTAIDSGATVKAGFDWEPTIAIQRQVVATSTGKLLKDEGTGVFSTTLKTGLTGVMNGRFVAGGAESIARNRKLFYADGTNPIQVLSGDGLVTTDLSSPAVDWTGANQPYGLSLHNGRLVGFGNLNDPHRIYLSTQADHEVFTGASALQFAVYPGVGQRIVAAVSFKGRLFLFKYPLGIFYLDDEDPVTSNWSIKQLTDAAGVAMTPYASVNIDDDIAFLGPNAHVYLLTAVSTFGDISNADLTERLDASPTIVDNISLNRTDHARMVYNQDTKELLVALTRIDSTVNNVKTIYDFAEAPDKRFKLRMENRGDVAEALWIRRIASAARRPYTGDNIGFVREMDRSSKSIDSVTPYTGEFQTVYTDFGWHDQQLVARRKLWDFLSLVFEPQGSFNASVDFFIDGTLVKTGELYNLGGGGATLGSFILGTDKLGGDVVGTRTRPAIGEGVRLSFAVRNTGLNEDFSIVKAVFGFRLGATA